jgi:hypothetical protein
MVMNKFFKASAIAAAAASIATALPAAAITLEGNSAHVASSTYAAPGTEEAYNQYRDRYDRRYDDRRYDNRRYNDRRGYRDERVYRNTRTWRGNDGRYYCRKKNGTTGLIIGGAAGALLGREIDGGRDRTLGTILGAGAGALLGREVDRGGSRCR